MSKKNQTPNMPPALSREARESQLVSLAYDEAERRIRDGTATSQLLSHFLKMGSTNNLLEQQIMTENVTLAKAKTDAIISAQREEINHQQILEYLTLYRGGM